MRCKGYDKIFSPTMRGNAWEGKYIISQPNALGKKLAVIEKKEKYYLTRQTPYEYKAINYGKI